MTPRKWPKLWYDEPDCLKIRLEPGEAKLSFFDHDTRIIKKINGEEMGALVPTHSLPESFDWAPVQLAGRHEGCVILYFPVSNEGRATWMIPEEEFNRLLIKD